MKRFQRSIFVFSVFFSFFWFSKIATGLPGKDKFKKELQEFRRSARKIEKKIERYENSSNLFYKLILSFFRQDKSSLQPDLNFYNNLISFRRIRLMSEGSFEE